MMMSHPVDYVLYIIRCQIHITLTKYTATIFDRYNGENERFNWRPPMAAKQLEGQI